MKNKCETKSAKEKLKRLKAREDTRNRRRDEEARRLLARGREKGKRHK